MPGPILRFAQDDEMPPSLNPMLFEPVPQRVPADPQPLRRTGLVALALPERLFDERALPLVERHAWWWKGRIRFARGGTLGRGVARRARGTGRGRSG